MKSIVRYPERGKQGSNKYRGNCSPRLIEDLIQTYKIKSISDYMVGSGTTKEVAIQKGIIQNCYDLHSGFDLLNHEIQEHNEFIFFHPPYHNMIKYSDNMYSAEKVIQKYGYNPLDSDLSNCRSWDDFIKKLNYCTMKQFCSLEKGGRIAILMGDMRKNGVYNSMLTDIVKVGKLESIIIKEQFNCDSYRKKYNGNFIEIIHEYLMILKKDNSIYFNISIQQKFVNDIRDLKDATWKDVVLAILSEHKKSMKLSELYQYIDGHKKTLSNCNWKEKIRQTLQRYPNLFVSVDRGVWSMAS